jgi:DNA-binding LytR/AlgR family response regulator
VAASQGNDHRPVAVVAEDEDVLREELVTRLAQLWPGLTVVAQVSNGIDALAMIDLHHPDIAFLDIQMPGLTGLQVARQVSGQCHIAFLTAYDQYAVAAFEQGAVDYVLKPYDVDRLSATIARLKERLNSSPLNLTELLNVWAAAARPTAYLTWIRASHGADVDLIMVQDVCYFRAETKYTTVVTNGGETLIRRSIKHLEAELDPAIFWRVHRSTIVNLTAISSVTRTLGGGMALKLKNRPEKLDVSEQYRNLFRHM